MIYSILRRRALAGLIALGWMLSAAQAAPVKKPSAVKCPQCMMKMSLKKTAATPVAMKFNGKTYYCCAGCKSNVPSGPAHGAKKAAKKVAKTTKIPDCPKCNMAMQATPSLLKKTPITVNGKTYYCCTICPKH